MSTFAVVRTVDDLPRLLSDLEPLWHLRSTTRPAGHPPLIGVWIEHPDDRDGSALATPDWLSARSSRVAMRVELAGLWAVCTTEQMAVSRLTLLADILADTPGRRGKFVPVFARHEPRRQWLTEWRLLALAHPGRVLRPLFQSATGRIEFGEETAWTPPRHIDRLGRDATRSSADV